MSRGRANRRKSEPRRIPRLRLPRITINWRALIVPPLVVMTLLVAAELGRGLLDRPVRALIVEGAFQRVTPVQVEAALDAAHGQSFFSLDLDALKDQVAAIDWIDEVEITRVWPGSLRVRITEHQAAASWGERGLLNTRGELFTEDARHEYAELPKLAGPQGSEHRVATLYLHVRGRLADANLMLEGIEMDGRGAIEIHLAGGQEVRIGRRDVDARLDRFFLVAVPALADQLGRVEYVDLRYPNGFAVGWREDAADPDQMVSQLAEADNRG